MTKLTIEVSEEEMQMVLDKRKEQKESQVARFPRYENGLYILSSGEIVGGYLSDEVCARIGNEFKTKEDAEYVEKHQKLYRAMFHFANERGGVQEFVPQKRNFFPTTNEHGDWIVSEDVWKKTQTTFT